MVRNGEAQSAELYEEGYFTHEDPTSGHRDFESDWAHAYDRRRFSHELRDIIGAPGGGRLLDVGSATGVFLAIAQEHCWDGVGVEVSDAARALARERGVESYKTLGDLPSDELFPVITMHHVLEHLADPVAALESYSARLAPQGRLVVEVPNYASTERRAMRADWGDLRPEQHRWQFEPETLRRLLDAAGLRVQRMTTRGEPVPTLPSVARSLRIPVPNRSTAIGTTGTASVATPTKTSASHHIKQRLAARTSTVVDAAVNRLLLGKRLVAVATLG